MAPGISADQYVASTVNMYDSPRLSPEQDAKPGTPPPIPLPSLDKTPPSRTRGQRWNTQAQAERLMYPVGPSTLQPQRQISYTSMKRDILYGAINEFKLTGSRLSAYDELLTRLSFDLTPTHSQGHTWFSCRGRKDDRSACHRLVPEVYFRTAVGKLLKAADKLEVRGDDLVEELAAALSYAICSAHNRNIHKIVRAIKFSPVVQQWREERPARVTTPNESTSKPPSIRDAPVGEMANEAASVQPIVTHQSVQTIADELTESVAIKPLDIRGRIKVERPYQDFIRDTHNRERRSGSITSANTGSTSSTRSKSLDRRFAERLGLGK